MSHTLVDHHGVTVGRYVGPRGVPMIQIEVHQSEGGYGATAIASMTLREFDRWLADLLGEMNRVSIELGDSPDPRTIEAMRRQIKAMRRASW
jgi:hypothetical protein